MSSHRDRNTLLEAARILRGELEARSQGGGFRSQLKLKAVDTYTDGWCVTLGHTIAPRLNLELWLDRYPVTKNRRFYYGFYTPHPADMKYLKDQLPRHLRSVRQLSDADYEKVSPGVWLLRKRLQRDEFDRPIYEDYKRYMKSFYGVYVPMGRQSVNNVRRMVNRAADFFSEVMWLLPKGAKLAEEVLPYPQHERWVVRKHLVRERSPELARACKRRDGFRCQVCKMTFVEVYGKELGSGFAEAHHLLPLSRKRANEKTRLKDLVTVCANCHRMLHLMRGREHDLEELKRAMKKQRRTK